MASIRPLAPSDDLESFDCGRPSLNEWFRRRALGNHLGGVSRVNVLVDAPDGGVIGYVALSSAYVERAFLPKSQQRNRPDPLPATLLGQLAIDRRFQGKGWSVELLGFALKTALVASRSIASIGVITHPLDDGVREFYARHGFRDLPFDPRRAMIVRMVDLEKAFAE